MASGWAYLAPLLAFRAQGWAYMALFSNLHSPQLATFNISTDPGTGVLAKFRKCLREEEDLGKVGNQKGVFIYTGYTGYNFLWDMKRLFESLCTKIFKSFHEANILLTLCHISFIFLTQNKKKSLNVFHITDGTIFLLWLLGLDGMRQEPAIIPPVLRIHDILVWIRIRGSMPPTNGSGSRFGSGSCFFHHWPTRRRQKILKKFLCILIFECTFTSFVKDKKSKRSHKTVEIKVFLTIFA